MVTELTGRELTVGAWRIAYQRKTKTNPAPDPATYRRGLRGKPRPLWRTSHVAAWAHNRVGHGFGISAPELPGYWNARQCAEHADIRRVAWWDSVARKTRTNPAPDPVPVDELPPEYSAWRYWRPDEVKTWNAARPGPQRLARVEAALPPGCWTVRQCAHAADVTPWTWMRWCRDDEYAPLAVDRIEDQPIWSADEVCAYLRARLGPWQVRVGRRTGV